MQWFCYQKGVAIYRNAFFICRRSFLHGISLFLFCGLIASPALAMQALRFHAPVWVQSDQQPATALDFDSQLSAGQTLSTDLQAWAQLGLADASRLLLAANSKLQVLNYSVAEGIGGAVHLELVLSKGKLEYRPSKIGAQRKRQLLIEAGDFVIHALDLPLWLSVNPRAAQVCSDQAGIVYSTPEAQLRQTQKPGCFLLNSDGQIKATRLSAATGMQPKRGQQSISGIWTLQLLAAPDLPAAQQFKDSLRSAGYAADIDSQQLKNKTWHRVVINQFNSAKDAEQIAAIISKHWQLEKPWWRKQGD